MGGHGRGQALIGEGGWSWRGGGGCGGSSIVPWDRFPVLHVIRIRHLMWTNTSENTTFPPSQDVRGSKNLSKSSKYKISFRTEVPSKSHVGQLVLNCAADADVTGVSPTFVRLFKLFEFLVRNLVIFLETNVFEFQSPVGLL